jgi:hypothetical protein
MKVRHHLFTILLAGLLSVLLLTGQPAAALLGSQVSAAQEPVYLLENGVIQVAVSTRNGGFSVRTHDGDLLNKADDNKRLLYHSDWYDTSFTSFEVTDHTGAVKEYVFGGNYSFLGLGGNNLTVTQDTTGISAAWSVGQLTFTQRIELANAGASEHGMVYLSYGLVNHGSHPVSARARVLLDTALGDQDYATYEVVNAANTYRRVTRETVIGTDDYIPANFFGYDDLNAPSITSYTVNDAQSKPYQVAFGHWNNLAATCFGFAPDASLDFTNPYNLDYQTADSAYALYYDMGQATAGAASASVATYYGVFSNAAVTPGERVAVNVSAPTALSLNADKTAYRSTDSDLADGSFSIQAQVNNIVQTGASAYPRVAVAVYTENGITPLDSFGHDLDYPVSHLSPYQIEYLDFAIGQTQTTRFYFRAVVDDQASYRKVAFKVFSMPETAQGQLLQENLLGSASLYILCPGGNGNLPSVLFTSLEPQIAYNEGTRHLTVCGTNFNMLEDKGRYTLSATYTAAVSSTDSKSRFIIPADNISFPETNVMDIILTETMPAGSYALSFDWIDPPAGIPKNLTAPVLRVVMSDDRTYKNDCYGIVAVVQLKNGLYNSMEYKIRTYKTEEDFAADAANVQEVLLAFRGIFTVEAKNADGPARLTAVSGKSTDNGGTASANNLVTINNCIDFEDGTVSIYYEDAGIDQAICVDFDGRLYTSQERSLIWSGYAAFTAIKNGDEYGLIPYNSTGERLGGFEGRPITLIWPSGLGVAQTIGGMIFNLSYGALGVMYSDDEDTGSWPSKVSDLDARYPVAGHVLSFSAALDLSFLIPQRSKTTEEKNWDSMVAWMNTEDQNGTLLRNRWNGLEFNGKLLGDEPAEESKVKDEKTGKVIVHDILYGCGEGYLGFNCDVEVALPPYIEAMPTMKGKLSIATVNGWSLGVSGSMKFTTIEMEFDIGLIGYNGFPIPDKLYFFVSGFEPGINVDGCGVLWITGGGGGFSDLYKTIFVSSGVPPLKLLLSASFDILKVLSARTDLSLSLRGLSLTASDVSLKATELKILNKAVLGFEWYPKFNFIAAVSADLLGIIKGSGYLVVVNDATYHNFVEFFIRALIGIPEVVPVVGGMTVGGVELGVNNQRIWGVLSVIGIKLGISYYWGGDIDFGSGKGTATPTFPELLALIDETGKTGIAQDVPLYKDAESGETLYMRIGTNAHVSSPTQWVSQLDSRSPEAGSVTLLGSTTATVQSTIDKLSHTVRLGAWNGEPSIITLRFAAASRAAAGVLAGQIRIRDEATSPATSFPLDLFDASANGGAGNADTANANLTFDPAAGAATLAFTLTDAASFGRTWSIATPVAADLILYDVAALPSVDSVSVASALNASAGDTLDLDVSGRFTDMSSVSFYLVAEQELAADPAAVGTFLGTVPYWILYRASSPLRQSYPLPHDLAAGTYVVKAVYSADGLSSGRVLSTERVRVVNPDEPAGLDAVTIRNSGDLTFAVNVDDTSNDNRTDSRGDAACDGYLLNVYTCDPATGSRTPTDISQLTRDKEPDADGKLQMPELSVGGSYQRLEQTADGQLVPAWFGLEPGQTYQVGIVPYNHVYLADDQTIAYTVTGPESFSNCLALRAATPPEVTLACLTASSHLARTVWSTDSQGQPAQVPVIYDTFRSKNLRYLARADTPVSGSWYLDGNAATGSFQATDSLTIALSGLSDGDHTLRLSGVDAEGDSFLLDKVFTVDTTPPILLLSVPAGGSFFAADGSLALAGVCDPDSYLTLMVDGTRVFAAKTVAAAGGTVSTDGVFQLPVRLDASQASHDLELLLSDAAGNTSRAKIRVLHPGLADLASVRLVMSPATSATRSWQIADGSNLAVADDGATQVVLGLQALTSRGQTFIFGSGGLVDWEVHTLQGESALSMDGLLTIEPGSFGYVVASLLVAANGSLSSALTFGSEAFSSIGNVPTPIPTVTPAPEPTSQAPTQSATPPAASPTAATPTGGSETQVTSQPTTTATTTSAGQPTGQPTTAATTTSTGQPTSQTTTTATSETTTGPTTTSGGATTPTPSPVPPAESETGGPSPWIWVALVLAAGAVLILVLRTRKNAGKGAAEAQQGG